jgi:hypothetical protein
MPPAMTLSNIALKVYIRQVEHDQDSAGRYRLVSTRNENINEELDVALG